MSWSIEIVNMGWYEGSGPRVEVSEMRPHLGNLRRVIWERVNG